MLFTRLYYQLKPVVPSLVRLQLRRVLSGWSRRIHHATWPIDPGAATPPADWPGWPGGNKFAVVLTHDVEGPKGLGRCHELLQIEQELGFRSSFNFIPEAGYRVSREFRDSITSRGFEVGVHDLRHDGKLYWSREAFASGAKAINRYLQDWNAVGFRSGFMHHNLDWLHDLDIRYDMSTFDTDPFEPQPHGMHTIFPFWVPNPHNLNPNPNIGAPTPNLNPNPNPILHAGDGSDQSPRFNDSTIQRFNEPSRGGYVELPYTLPQDSTLFLLFRERTIDIWRAKLDWVAKHGGMALLNVHPDYMAFSNGQLGAKEFPGSLYRQFLQYIRDAYQGQFWNALPHEVAEYTRKSITKVGTSPQAGAPLPATIHGRVLKRTIWVDLDNTPHVPFFLPIMRELERRGHRVVCSARNAFQVCELARKKGIHFAEVGHHYGKNPVAKVYGLFYRAAQLVPWILHQRPVLAVSHGSRSQLIASNFLRIPTVLLTDYEFAKYPPLMRPRWEMVPDAIPGNVLYCDPSRVRTYPGIKEDVYVPEFVPDASILQGLGLHREDIVVTVRPPATEAHYHNPESELLFTDLMEFLLEQPRVRVVLLPRNAKQASDIKITNREWFSDSRVVVPSAAVDGLNLLYHSDLVVSGGGTMNREAAALGVPVYSIFRGPIGAVDRYLAKKGQLVLITTAEEIRQNIKIEPRSKSGNGIAQKAPALDAIVSHIEEILALESA